MSRIWIGFAVACGVVAGTVFAAQPEKAAEPVSGGAVAGKGSFLSAISAAGPAGCKGRRRPRRARSRLRSR